MPRRPSRPKLLALLLDAGHDASGNPQRCFLVLTDTGGIHDVIEQGYSGLRCLKDKYPGVPLGIEIKIPLVEYQEFLTRAKS